MENLRPVQLTLATAALPFLPAVMAAQTGETVSPLPSIGSIATPRPIDPSAGTTNPSARTTKILNPYLGSTPSNEVVTEGLQFSLGEAVSRGLQFNLGLIDENQADATVHAQRERAFAALLPQISARAQETFQQLSYEELNIKLPPKLGLALPPTSGGFGYGEARIVAQSSVLNIEWLDRYKEQKTLESASKLNVKDARDVVVFAVGAAYFQVVASQARLETARPAQASAQELNRQITDQYNSEVSPEIDALRARVELDTANQRVTNAANDLEKDKLTLDRITGIALAQHWTPSGNYDYSPLPDQSIESSTATQTRADLASAQQEVFAAELGVRAARSQRLPSISFEGTYGGGGINPPGSILWRSLEELV
jgi:outer membrane protein TolC